MKFRKYVVIVSKKETHNLLNTARQLLKEGKLSFFYSRGAAPNGVCNCRLKTKYDTAVSHDDTKPYV